MVDKSFLTPKSGLFIFTFHIPIFSSTKVSFAIIIRTDANAMCHLQTDSDPHVQTLLLFLSSIKDRYTNEISGS